MDAIKRKIEAIQTALAEEKLDAWLFCDFHNRDSIAYQVLELDAERLTTRRWFYVLPKHGKPIKIVHRIESDRLDDLPGEKVLYTGWEELHQILADTIQTQWTVAMQYSSECNVPSVSLVDAGTVDLIRKIASNVVTSANLVQTFTAKLSNQQIESHIQAGKLVDSIKDRAFDFVSQKTKKGERVSEFEVQELILSEFDRLNLTCEGILPIVAVNENAANPHYEPSKTSSAEIKRGDRLLIDLWAKLKSKGSIFYDITWCAYLGETPPDEFEKMFATVCEARDEALLFVEERFAQNKPVKGFEVDDVCRSVIKNHSYGDYFIHRTGHSIDDEIHGKGANIDNLETKDDREIIRGACFSLEPGIYKHPYGVRAEINVVVDNDGKVHSYGKKQNKLLLI